MCVCVCVCVCVCTDEHLCAPFRETNAIRHFPAEDWTCLHLVPHIPPLPQHSHAESVRAQLQCLRNSICSNTKTVNQNFHDIRRHNSSSIMQVLGRPLRQEYIDRKGRSTETDSGRKTYNSQTYRLTTCFALNFRSLHSLHCMMFVDFYAPQKFF